MEEDFSSLLCNGTEQHPCPDEGTDSMPAEPAVLPSATEPLLNVCVQKMMQRSKLAFGNVETGRAHKAFPINVVIPNGKEATPDAPLMLFVHHSYTKGQQQPEVLHMLSGAPVVNGQGIAIPVGHDRTQLLVHYAPSVEDADGASGAIALHCTHAGMLLKAELSYSARAVSNSTANAPTRKPPSGTSSFGGASRALPKGSLPPGPVRTASLRGPLQAGKPGATAGAARRSTADGTCGNGSGAGAAGGARRSTADGTCSNGITGAAGGARRSTADGSCSSNGISMTAAQRGSPAKPLGAAAHTGNGAQAHTQGGGGDSEQPDAAARTRGRDQGPHVAGATAHARRSSGGGESGEAGARVGKPSANRQLFPPQPAGAAAPHSEPPPEPTPCDAQASSADPTQAAAPAQHSTHTAPLAPPAGASKPPTAAVPRPPRPTPQLPKSSLNLAPPPVAVPPSGVHTSTPKRGTASASTSVQSSPQQHASRGSAASSPYKATLSSSCVLSAHQVTPGLASSTRAPLRSTPTKPGLGRPASQTHLERHTEAPMLKQERALCAWLNGQLSTHHLEFDKLQTEDPQTQALTMQRLTAQARGLLWRQFKKSDMVYNALRVPFAKIEAGVFNLTEEPIIADVSKVQRIMEPLLCYHPFWLRLGLLIVTKDAAAAAAAAAGDSAAGAGSGASERRSLQALVKECLLLGREMHEGIDKKASWLEHRDMMLKNFLQLVLLLDRTMSDPSVKLPRGCPPLFHPHARLKSSRQVVQAFLSGRMRGIGDALYHLELWGLRLDYVQQAVDEIDFSVNNLREDLRCGVRLAKLHSLLTGLPSLLDPADSGQRPLWISPGFDQQRMDNMERVVTRYRDVGILPAGGQSITSYSGTVVPSARELVDANRDVTLGVLWSIATKWQVPRLLSTADLLTEVRRLHRLQQVRARRPVPEPVSLCPSDKRANLLLKWVQAACGLHGMHVHDTTTSFGDGRALCYLVSTYLPDWLPADAVYQPPLPSNEDLAVLMDGDEGEQDMEALRSKGWCAVYEAGGCIDDQGLLRAYREGIHHNFGLLHDCAARLGKVPHMLSPDDFMDGGVEAGAVHLYLAHLANRLLELSREDRAAHLITQALRQHVWEKKCGPYVKPAAIVIQKNWRGYLGRREAALARAEAAEAAARAAEAAERARARAEAEAAQEAQRAAIEAAKQRQREAIKEEEARVRAAERARAEAARVAAAEEAERQRIAAEEVAEKARVEAEREAEAQRAQAAAEQERQEKEAEAARALEQAREQAATRIQAAWRGYCVQRTDGPLPRLIRRVLVKHKELVAVRYAAKAERAAVVLQASWRMHVCRVSFLQQRQQISVLQALLRMHAQRAAYLDLRGAAVLSQRTWRTSHARAQARAATAQERATLKATLQLQAAVRARAVRSRWTQQRAAATQLQASWRARATVHAYHQQCAAALSLQSAWRARACQQQLATTTSAATQLQAYTRARASRQCFAASKEAAVAMQSAWRARAAQQQLAQIIAAATDLQAVWRARAARTQHAQQQAAAVCLQGLWRTRAAAHARAHAVHAATTVQALWRGLCVRTQLAQQREAATALQACWRARVERQRFEQLRAGVETMQACWRGKCVRAAHARERGVAVVVQAAWRTHAAITSLANAKHATTVLQSAWRQRAAQAQLTTAVQAAVLLQAAVRGLQARQAHQKHRSAAVHVQSLWRGRQVRSAVKRQHQAASSISRAWRGFQARRQWGWARKAAITIQASTRMWSAQRKYCARKQAAVRLQAAWRAQQARRQLQQRKAIVCMQAAWRGRCVRAEVARQHAAATQIQAAWRMAVQRRCYQSMQWAAIVLQAAARARTQHSQLCAQRAAADQVAAAWRARCQRVHLAQLRQAACVLQGAHRAKVARQHAQQQRTACMVLQAAWRARTQRHAYDMLRSGVVLLQAHARGLAARKHASACREAATVFQSAWRTQAAQQQLQQLRTQCAAATIVQAHVRRHQARKEAHARQVAIVAIQSWVRGQACRKRLAQERAVAEFEATARAYMHKCQSASRVQAHVRGYLARKAEGPRVEAAITALRTAKAALVMQTAIRAWSARKNLHQRRAALATLTAYVPLMRARMVVLRARRHAAEEGKAVAVLQSYVRARAARKQMDASLQGIRRLQALWRGHSVRMKDGRQKAEARQRLHAAAVACARNPHCSIGARVRDALAQLMARKDPAQLAQAIAAMEVGTRYSRACCEIIAEEGGLSSLMRLIRVLNRSKPHLDLLLGVLRVLQSICRHPSLVPAVFFSEDCVCVLTERLQFFRDQEDVFMNTMSVLQVLLEPQGHALEVAKMPNIIKQWEGIAQIILRKIDMEQKYIARLEGQKGSDYSAKEATRKVISGAKQLDSLQTMIGLVLEEATKHHIPVVHHNTLPFGCHQTLPTGSVNLSQPPPLPAAEPTWVPKNTLVRYTLRDIHARQQEQQRHLAALAEAAAAAEADADSPRDQNGTIKYVSSMTAGITEAHRREEELQRWQARRSICKAGVRHTEEQLLPVSSRKARAGGGTQAQGGAQAPRDQQPKGQ